MPVCEYRNMTHPSIEPSLQVLSSGKVGLFAGRVKIDAISSGAFSTCGDAGKDRLKLTIPFAGQSIQWHVFFDSRHPDIAPDFDFLDENFLTDMDANLLDERLPSLVNWNKESARGMLNVIQEFLVLYRTFQIKQLTTEEVESRNAARFQVTSLIESGSVSEEDLEVLVGRRDTDPVHVMVRLAVDLSSLPESVLPAGSMSPEDDVAALLINFPGTSTGRYSAQLFLSPRIDEIFGGNKNLRIPNYNKHENLTEYVGNIKALIDHKIQAIASNYNKRKMFLETLLNQMGRACVEFDSVNYTYIAFLMEWNNFHFLVKALLPPNFPEEKPAYMFQSVYHSYNELPFVTKCTDFPYSPRWDAIEMADRAKNYILDYIDTFQKESIRRGQQF